MLSIQRNEFDPKTIIPPKSEPDFHGASLVLENGIEIPITEAMVRCSLEQIIKEQSKTS